MTILLVCFLLQSEKLQEIRKNYKQAIQAIKQHRKEYQPEQVFPADLYSKEIEIIQKWITDWSDRDTILILLAQRARILARYNIRDDCDYFPVLDYHSFVLNILAKYIGKSRLLTDPGIEIIEAKYGKKGGK